MSILIKGLQMPQKGTSVVIVIEENGNVSVPDEFWDCELLQGVKAVELPDHGDLVEVERAYDEIAEQAGKGNYIDMDAVDAGLQNAPVVIPAERSEAILCDNCDWKNEKGCSLCKRMERSEE